MTGNNTIDAACLTRPPALREPSNSCAPFGIETTLDGSKKYRLRSRPLRRYTYARRDHERRSEVVVHVLDGRHVCGCGFAGLVAKRSR
jgi:hypothetical protein